VKQGLTALLLCAGVDELLPALLICLLPSSEPRPAALPSHPSPAVGPQALLGRAAGCRPGVRLTGLAVCGGVHGRCVVWLALLAEAAGCHACACLPPCSPPCFLLAPCAPLLVGSTHLLAFAVSSPQLSSSLASLTSFPHLFPSPLSLLPPPSSPSLLPISPQCSHHCRRSRVQPHHRLLCRVQAL
jgi:hypothetical protein